MKNENSNSMTPMGWAVRDMLSTGSGLTTSTAVRSQSPRPRAGRTRSTTIVGTVPVPSGSGQIGPPSIDVASASLRIITEPSHSAAAHALAVLKSNATSHRPKLPSSVTVATASPAHQRTASWPEPPISALSAIPPVSTLLIGPNAEVTGGSAGPRDRVQLVLSTYKPANTAASAAQPSPLPSKSSFSVSQSSHVLLNYAALPWHVLSGDLLEIRKIRRPDLLAGARARGMGGELAQGKVGGEALRKVDKRSGRDAFIFRLGEDAPQVPVNQVQVPESVASAFRLQHRLDVEIVLIRERSTTHTDYIELRFTQYVGRADMWRLGMSLENTIVHVGERVALAGGAVRAEVTGLWRGRHRYSSGMVTPKTKTIYRSRSAQVYLFIQLCQETWEFDEDGERYYEKIVHGFLPELFTRWSAKGASHLVTVVLFARVLYNEEEISYLRAHDVAAGLMQDTGGRWCKDFFRVVIDFDRRSDWNMALGEIKQSLETSEKDILLDFHLTTLHKNGHRQETNKILGRWSFAYEGNILEAINLALNPFDEHYIDRDLSRTGLNMTVVTPGTGHFAVNKNLLRLTTERMVDHGVGLDLVCLTRMPLHSVPLFSYVSKRPKKPLLDEPTSGMKTKSGTPDLLYFDAHLSTAADLGVADCYSIPNWVNSSFYAKTHDKPFRHDRFVPRCKMYEIQMLGILDHNLTTVTVPFLDIDDWPRPKRNLSERERKRVRDDFDALTFGNVPELGLKELPSHLDHAGGSLSVSASYQSSRLLAKKAEESTGSVPAARAGLLLGEPSETLLRGLSRHRTDTLMVGSQLGKLELQKGNVQATSPTPSSLSIERSAREPLQARSRASSIGRSSGASTPKVTAAKKLRPQGNKGGSFISRIVSSSLFAGLTSRAQISYPAAAVETVSRQAVSTVAEDRPGSPVITVDPPAAPRPVPGAIVTPSTPSPIKDKHVTQPMAIGIQRTHVIADEDSLSRSHRSAKLGKSPATAESSWGKAANFHRGKSHVTVNPSNPKFNAESLVGVSRRWQHVRLRPSKESQHVVKWTSLCIPACLPLTTDFMPTPHEIQDFYEINSYDVACYPDQISFLIRLDAAHTNLPLAVMREMASQRLSQNFQLIVLPHDQQSDDEEKTGSTRKILHPGDSTRDGLRIGGASDVLRDASGAIYMSWSNHIHRLAFDSAKQSVTVQRFVRKLKYSTDPVLYECLVWASQTKGFQKAEAVFNYPNIDAKLNFNYLDMLIAGEEEQNLSASRYWRTRYILIPSGKDPLTIQGVVPKGENFNQAEILINGASRVLEILGRHQWTRPGQSSKPLRLLPTTFDPSACVLDEGLMTELERVTKGEVQMDGGKAIEGMTLHIVAEMMCQPNNGLVIRDRWWNFSVHEDSFTGIQFSEWLQNTFIDVKSPEEATDWGRSLFDKGLIEHVIGVHGFFAYEHFYYRLRPSYDINANKRKKAKSWFGGRPPSGPRDLIEIHAAMSTSPGANTPLGKLGDSPGQARKRKIRMSQRVIVDLDPGKKSDRAEVAILHADVIHNAHNAFHFELNWLGVTAGLLDELRIKCSAQAERYGLRFVEAPVEQIKDISMRCAYRAAIPIPLALAPPLVPNLHLRLAKHGTGQPANFFEYAILTQRFDFVLDVEATSRYPETIEVEYAYRGRSKFDCSQFCHESGLALVQCIGGKEGFLWCDNRLYIAAPSRGRGAAVNQDQYPNAPVPLRMTKQEEAVALRGRLEAFCADALALREFYDEVLRGLGDVGSLSTIEEEADSKIKEEARIDRGPSRQGSQERKKEK